jgi:Mn2+/Fe2+ NRAMP family transporter
MSNDRRIMGGHTNGPWLNVLGWTATVLMTAAAVALLVTSA